MVKDNVGKAARQAHIRRIIVVIGLCSCVVCVYKINPQRNRIPRRKVRGKLRHHTADKDIQLTRILSAEVHLVDLTFSHRGLGDDNNAYSGVSGVFCKLEWSKHKANPSSYPMLRDLSNPSPNCRVQLVNQEHLS